MLLAALAVCAGLVLPVPAHAAPEVIASSQTPLKATMSSNGRFVVWQNVFYKATVVDRQTMTSVDYALDELRAGVPASHIDQLFGISDDGRFLTYSVSGGGTYGYTTAMRFDRTTGTHVVLFDNKEDWGASWAGVVANPPRVAVSRDGQTLAWIRMQATPALEAQVMVWRATHPVPTSIGTTCLMSGGIYVTLCMTAPAVSGDGQTVLYTAGSNWPAALAYYDVATGAKTYYPQVQPMTFVQLYEMPTLTPSLDASYVIARSFIRGNVLFDRPRTRVDPLEASAAAYMPMAVSDDGARVLLNARDEMTWASAVLDRPSGLQFALPADERALALTADGSAALMLRRDLNALAFVLLVRSLDDDADGMLDGWESFFGLDPTDATDASEDANGDGSTNLQSFLDRGHPTALGSATRYFAEGAGGSFFDTTVSLFNPGTTDATVVTRFLGSAGQQTSHTRLLPALQRLDIASCCLPTLDATEFSILVESTQPLVAERRMSWDRASGYGSHASTGTPDASTTWHFAEGATIAGFQTFLLVQNPGATAVDVTIDYLVQGGSVVTRSHVVPAHSRQTVWVNQQGAPLDAAEFASRVTATSPIVVERAMYRDVQGQTFGAGSNAMGVTAPATTWAFAEGATGDYFDTFILVANAGQTAGTVTATYSYVDAGGAPQALLRSYAISPQSRLTIWVDQEHPELANTAVSTLLTSDVPVVAERSMWWPGSVATWAESHTEFGATEGGTHWAVADAEVDLATGTDTFLLVHAQTGGTPATARVVAYPSNGLPITREVPLVAGRNTLWMAVLFPEVAGQRFSVRVTSLDRPGGAATLMVEKALYSRWFEAGAASLATRLPDPVP
jgi:hypothetical protein